MSHNYLQKWKESVISWPGFEEEEKTRMLVGIQISSYDHAQWYFKDSICLKNCILGVCPSVLSDKLN